jgi:histidine ammonia-lyase
MRDLRPGPEPSEGRAPASSVLDDDLADRPLTDHATAAALPNRSTDTWRGSAA